MAKPVRCRGAALRAKCPKGGAVTTIPPPKTGGQAKGGEDVDNHTFGKGGNA